MSNDRVERSIELRAPRARVWKAISNGKDFGTWFGLGTPLELRGDFVPGAAIDGVWTLDGKEVHEQFCIIERVEPERMLAFTWVPYELSPGESPDGHPRTLIEFRLDEIEGGTRLTVSESGFSKLPPDKQYKRAENAQGWAAQVHSIAQHVLGRIDVRVEATIARPLAEVMEAIVDPAKLARGSTRMQPGAVVEWEWPDAGAKHDVHVRAVEPGKVMFFWSASGAPSVVTIALTADGDATKIAVTETPFELSEAAAARAIRQTQGWTHFCCSLEAYLVHGVTLRTGRRVA